MVKILGSMLLNVSIFMLLFTALFLIFAAIGLLIFQDLEGFSTPTLTLTTLFSACLGNFDYTIFDSAQEVSPYVGYIFLTIFLLFTMIMLMNFLIAILSNIYANLNDVQIGLYLRKVLYLRQRSNYDERFSSIIYALPPMNIISFMLLPLIAYFKSPKLNNLILLFQYIPVWVTAIIIFIIFSILILPLAYGLLIFYKASNLPNKPIFGMKDLFLRIIDLLVFAFFGLFIIGFWIILDVVNYVVRLYDSNIIYINSHEEDELEKINKSMDGIEKYRESINQGKEFSKDGEEKKTFMRTKTINRVLNPIKEGLSDNTLKILKAWLKSVRDRHFKAVGMLDKDNFKYIPTVWVLFEMKEILMIPEQINAILFGVTYYSID